MTEITLDWDISFDTFRNSVSFDILKKWVRLRRELIKVECRKSSHGNTHIRITLSDTIEEMTMYQIRSYLRDDIYRIGLDLIRAYQGKPTNRLWDEKYDSLNGEILKAGDWIDMTEEVIGE